MRKHAAEFLKRKDLHQIVRRELCFGLIPKTLRRKNFRYSIAYQLNLIAYNTLAGENQQHITRNAFNVLANEGFLRDQGILSLESVQKFYQIIKEEPSNASMMIKNLLSFCNQLGYNELGHQPVITLVKRNSTTGDTQGHAVVLHSYNRGDDYLVLLTADSASATGYTFIFCRILIGNGRQKLMIGGLDDKLCLGSDECFFFYYN